ncbi:MAG TPA: hypothetical protein VGV92_01755 [Gammaproteobacteria bacterium]|nr:hypothetical protein [Gammaproteobacteria bacterium]
MDNDPVNKANEEEYQFDDSENSTQFAPPSAKRPYVPVKENIPGGQKKIFIIIGIVVAVFCLYKLYGVFSAAPEKPKNEMPVPVVTVPQPVKAPVVVAPQELSTNQEFSVLQDKVGTLQKVVSQVSQSNANLQDQMAGVSTSIADIQNSISSLSQQVTALVKPKPVEEVKKPVEKKVVHAKSKRKEAVKSASVVKRADYYVKAMIQGRAWLMTPEGATLTIAEGDTLPGYGQIGRIDPARGEVTTSSGTIIGYRSDDR